MNCGKKYFFLCYLYRVIMFICMGFYYKFRKRLVFSWSDSLIGRVLYYYEVVMVWNFILVLNFLGVFLDIV